ncbi:MAG: hypothetical protein AAF402_11690 [Pseudomonadota bacterium]
MSTSCSHHNTYPEAASFRRTPETVMKLSRMGSFHQTRLSFMRVLLRRLRQGQWKFKRSAWEIDDEGFGHAVYTIYHLDQSYSLVAFSHELPDHMRSDRVIATAWDATFTLFDGIPESADIERLSANVPKQEAGRVSDNELSLSRANRSVRLWNHVIDSLAAGAQPGMEQLESVGYLVRTTAVYGSGKFGAADRVAISDRRELCSPFQAELLSVWLIRAFSIDLVEHIAKQKGGSDATVLDPAIRRRIGVGNSTGLGMAPFLVNHPTLINNWMMAREEAFARVRSRESASVSEIAEFRTELRNAANHVSQWQSDHPLQREKLSALKRDLESLRAYAREGNLNQNYPWDHCYRWCEQHLSVEAQEYCLSMMLEPFGHVVDELAECMDADEHFHFHINGEMTLGEVRSIIENQCQWATAIDFENPENRARFWYTSAEKLEPRLGERFKEPGSEYEQPLCIGYYISKLAQSLREQPGHIRISDFLLENPQFRHTIRRVQNLQSHPFAEIQDNLIAKEMLPIDLLRCKLSFFGATKFDPRSDRWVRICMYQNAPYPHELLT